jgi:hypothetical protein
LKKDNDNDSDNSSIFIPKRTSTALASFVMNPEANKGLVFETPSNHRKVVSKTGSLFIGEKSTGPVNSH